MSEEARVLVVEDEAPIRDGLVALFEGQGFAATAVGDGPAALEQVAAGGWDLVLLDWMIPGVEGIEVLRRLRAHGDDTPVLLLTAKGAEDDVVAGLEAGADDYVTKPFGVRELVARARTLVRRRPVDTEARRVRVGAVDLDLDGLEVRWGEGEARGRVRLTAREGRFLAYLLARRHRPVSREELLVDVWDYADGSIVTRTIDVHVMQLRAKLQGVPGGDGWVGTVRGRGYRFTGPVADEA